jgi:prephenate dehydrogenase
VQHAAESDDDALALAAGGFRDLTRIAESPFDLWREIFVGNQGSILDALADFARRLQRVQRQVAMGDMDALEDDFAAAQDARARRPEEAAGLMQSVHDCTVRVPDEAGALHAISKPLAEANVSVRNIELLRVRDGTGGTFRLSFRSREALHTALDVLNAAGFDAQAA